MLGPTGVEGNEDSLYSPGEGGALGFCESSTCTFLLLTGESYSAFDTGEVTLGHLCVPGLGELHGSEGAQTHLTWGSPRLAGLGHTATCHIR